MSHRREKRARRAARARAALVTAASLDILLLASPAHAQDADTQEIGEITVTGFRASLADALSRKRNSNLVMEAVTPEDLGKFPDQNIAESLQRLSGVQIDRVAGQGTQVRIRGLSQNISLLDDDFFLTGMELYKLGEGNTRYNDSLEGIPSELIGGVDVYKSSSANLVEGALGGTLNFKTRRALDMKEGFTIGGNVRVNQGDYLDDVEPSGAIVAAYNREDRFGVTASFSYDKLNIHEDELAGNNRANWRWINSVPGRAGPVPGTTDAGDASECIFDNWAGSGANCNATPGTAVAPYISPELLYTTHRDQYRERWGGSIGMDWKPNEATTLGFDWFHSNLDFSTEEVGNKVWFDSNNLGRGPDPSQPFVVDANGVVTEGTFRALGAEVISFVQAAEAESDNFQVAFAWDNGGALRANFKASYSTADMVSDSANNDVQKAPYGFPTPDAGSPTGWSSQPALNPTAPGGSTPYSFRYVNNGTLPSVEFLGGASDLLSNPDYTMFKSHWAFGDRSQDDAYAGRADFEFDPPFAENGNVMLSAGLRYSDRDIDFTSGRYLVDWSNMGELDGSQVLDADGQPQEFGSWFYFQDAAIGNKGCDYSSADFTRTIPGLPPGVNDCQRFGNSPLIVSPVQNVATNPVRSETIGSFFPSGNVGSDVVAQDRSQMRDPAGWLQSLYPNQTVQFFIDQPESFKINQKVTAGYVMADLGAPDDVFHVNFGARIAYTEQDVEQHGPAPGGRLWGSDTWNGVIRDFTTTVTTKSYTDVLPSMNAYIDFTEQQKVRLSMARVMSRPDPYAIGRGFQTFFTRESRDLNNDGDVTDPGEEGFAFSGGSAGNPDLDPFRASQVDLSYEFYYGRQNAIIATVFYKDVDSFIGNRTAPEVVDDDFGGSPGAVTRPFNGEGGKIQGVELGVQYAFDFGLGINANYTYSDSESPESTSFDASLPIQGVAENSFNGQDNFVTGGFDARLSYAWVDEIYRGSFGLNDGSAVYGRFDRDYGQFDGQVSYQITDQFGVLLGAVNITEEDQSQFLQFESQPFTYHSGERRLYFGVTGNF